MYFTVLYSLTRKRESAYIYLQTFEFDIFICEAGLPIPP